jgi:hypothetical protein
MAYQDICKSKRFNLIRLINSKGAWHLTGDRIQIKGMKRKAHAPSIVIKFKIHRPGYRLDFMKIDNWIVI